MSVRRFKADIGKAAAQVQQGRVTGVSAIGKGDSDGEVVITYHHVGLLQPIRIQALAQETSEYPDGNNFMLFTDSEDPPPEVLKAMEHVQEFLLGITVTDMVAEVAKAINTALSTQTTSRSRHRDYHDDEDEVMTDIDDMTSCDGGSETETEDVNFLGNDDEYFGLGPPHEEYQQHLPKGQTQHNMSRSDQDLRDRIRSDLRMAKQAGFRVGVFNGIGSSELAGTVCISVRVNKLGLSDEALMAWNVPATDYVVLLIRYDIRYFTLERLVELPTAHSGLQFRIGLCKVYKPAVAEAMNAFCHMDVVRSDSNNDGQANGTFRTMFISASLNQFMNESLISIIKLRLSQNASWDRANEVLLNSSLLHNNSFVIEGSTIPDHNSRQCDSNSGASTAAEGTSYSLLESDHLIEVGQARSFPLIAMQFAMRYFSRCTQYCLRCHRKVEDGFEALRPYVCSDPLCLFQYMAMGLGPNVEHEILTEPSVVDLLVSLCFASLQATTNQTSTSFPIREFPVGLRLQVPNLFEAQIDRPLPIAAKLDRNSITLLYGDDASSKRLRLNQWVVLRYRPADKTFGSRTKPLDIQDYTCTHDARITGIFLERRTVEIVLMAGSDMSGAVPTAFPEQVDKVDIFTYDVDFDTLTNAEKSIAMQHILNTIPPIAQIQEHLSRHPKATLRSCELISPAAASLLVWIVSSNRSCINEVGSLESLDSPNDLQKKPEGLCWTVKEQRKKEYIPNMHGYIQFRFSQGSPDKELLFSKALQEAARQKDLSRYPTIFGWHGSDVANWHSILRTGLDFEKVKNGRAFGNGVYFSPHLATSISYAVSANVARWANSAINVQSVLSLNEIINVPEKFVSSKPHYVVQEQDWHQCRYLFVSSSVRQSGSSRITLVTADGKRVPMLPQAPGYQVRGPAGQELNIPVASMPTRSTNSVQVSTIISTQTTGRVLDEDSDESSVEDQEVLALDGRTHRRGLSRSSSRETMFSLNT